MQYDNPYDIGMTGLLGYGAAAEGIEDADLLILLGTDFPYDQFLPGTRTAQVDRAAHKLGRRTDVDVAVHGDVLPTLAALMPLLQPKKSRRFLDEMLKKHDRLMNKAVGAYTRKVETKAADPPRIRGVAARPGGGEGRDLHRRHRHVQCLDRPVHQSAGHPPADRLVPARLHGQRAAARDRRPAGLPRAPGGRRYRATAACRCCWAS